MSPSFFTRSVSKRSLRSFSRATGMISLSVKSRAVSWMRRCSSVSSKSIKCVLRGSRGTLARVSSEAVPARDQSYTLIRTVAGQLLACGAVADLNAQFLAANASSSTDDYVPVEIEVVPKWVEYREGGGWSQVLFPGGEPQLERWVLNVVSVVTLSPVTVG